MEKEKKSLQRLKEDRSILLQTYAIFFATFALAFGITAPFITLTAVQELPAAHGVASNPGTFLISFGAATFLAIILVKYLSNDHFWKFFFGLAAFAGLFIAIFYIGIQFLPTNVSYGLSIALAILLLVARAITERVWLHNILIIFAVAGVARIFGAQFTPESIIFILVILAVYDIIAVYFSKHMISMAVTMFERNAFFGVVLPFELKNWKKTLSESEIKKNISIIGGGDLAFPLFFALSHLVYTSTLAFFIISIAVGFGVFVMHLLYILPNTKKAIPALPPLVLFSLLGHFIITLLP